MSSSGGGDDGGLSAMMMMRAANPIPGLPVAGKDSTIGDAYEYGQFQNFLPEIQAEGQNPMATGLRPEMFEYNKPSGVTNPETLQLRDELAKLKASGSGSPSGDTGAVNPQWAQLRASMSPQDLATFQSRVSPEEFKAFMAATSGGGGGAGQSSMLPVGFNSMTPEQAETSGYRSSFF